jgi:hypothetical protein
VSETVVTAFLSLRNESSLSNEDGIQGFITETLLSWEISHDKVIGVVYDKDQMFLCRALSATFPKTGMSTCLMATCRALKEKFWREFNKIDFIKKEVVEVLGFVV